MTMKYNTATTAATLEAECCPPAVSPMILSPCAACKTLRRRCAGRCVLSPYFPPTEPLKFAMAHRVFGAANIIKLLQEVGEDEREDAVNSMVYEANARLRDPIYGCAGAISSLHNHIMELQAELARAHAEIFNMQCQNANLLDQFCKNIAAQGEEEEEEEEDVPENLINPPLLHLPFHQLNYQY